MKLAIAFVWFVTFADGTQETGTQDFRMFDDCFRAIEAKLETWRSRAFEYDNIPRLFQVTCKLVEE